jgi:hypothetical protein
MIGWHHAKMHIVTSGQPYVSLCFVLHLNDPLVRLDDCNLDADDVADVLVICVEEVCETLFYRFDRSPATRLRAIKAAARKSE